LGQGAFQEGTKVKYPQNLNLTLARGESALFKHRFIFYEGDQTKAQLDKAFDGYAAKP
jgi:hypothetical protein